MQYLNTKYSVLFLALFSLISCSDSIKLSISKQITPGAIQSSWKATLPVAFQTPQATTPLKGFETAIATNNNNEALFIWTQSNGLGVHIYKSEYRNGTWHHPQGLKDFISPLGGSFNNINVKLADNGDALIVFKKDSWSFPSRKDSLYKIERRNNIWIYPSSLFDSYGPMSDNTYFYDIAMAPNGNSIILSWTNEAGTPILKSEYQNGSWSAAAPLPFTPDLDPNISGYAQIAVEMSNDLALIVWERNNIYYKAERLSPGNWSWPSLPSEGFSPSSGIYNSKEPKIAISANGDALIVWMANLALDSMTKLYVHEKRAGSWNTISSANDFFSIPHYGSSVGDISLAMNDIGESIISWSQRKTIVEVRHIYLSEYRVPGGWSHPVDIDDTISTPGHDSRNPKVSISNDSPRKALLNWIEDDGVSAALKLTEAQVSWNLPTTISVPGDDTYLPLNAFFSNGDAILSWINNSHGNIQASFKTSGTWTHPTSSLDSPTLSAIKIEEYYDLSINDSGKAVITWQQNHNDQCHILLSEFDGTNWTHPNDLSDAIHIGPNCHSLKVATDNKNDIILVWKSIDYDDITYNNDRNYIMKAERRNGNWSKTPDFTSISPEVYNVGYVDVAMSTNGDAFIVWQQNQIPMPSSNRQIYYSHYNPQTGWRHPANLSSGLAPSNQWVGEHPKIHLNKNGDALVIWRQSDGSDDHNFVASYKKLTDSWSKPSSINDHLHIPGSMSNNYALAFNDNGNAIYFWTQLDTSRSKWQLYRREFINGVWGSLPQLNDYISSTNNLEVLGLSASLSNTGEAIVAWTELIASGDIQLFKSEKTSGNWTTPELMSTPNSNPEWVTTAITGDQKIILWKEFPLNIKGQLFTPGKDWKTITFVNDYVDNFKLECNTTGSCLVAYPSQITSTERNIGLNTKLYK